MTIISKFENIKNKLEPQRIVSVSQAMVDFASETWRFRQTVEQSLSGMDPTDRQRFINHYQWYLRKIQAVLDESGLSIVDLTGERYDVGMAVSVLNLEDFPNYPDAVYTIEQMVAPIIIENGNVRKIGTVMLREEDNTK